MNDKYSLQARAYMDGAEEVIKSPHTARVFRDGVWHDYDLTPAVAPTLTFQEYTITGTQPSKRDPEKDEIACPVCACAGKEQVLDDRIRIYHPGRLIPCRAPEGYELQSAEADRLVSA